jgi:von Willebrand factor type A domain/Aerotolerance regulator N-terminal
MSGTTTLGVLNPAGALAFAAIAVLVLLHLRDRRRRVVPVAAFFLWKQVPARAVSARRFRRDLLFLLRLALLGALALGVLRPYLETAAPEAPGGRLLLVLDVSASMQAREPGGVRFELARRRARDLVTRLGGADEVMIVAAAERPHVWLRWTSDTARVFERLEALEPLDTPTNLAPAVELAASEARARGATRVAVLTDLDPEAAGLGDDTLAAVDWLPVGQTDDNVAIASLAVERPPFQPVQATSVTLVVQNHGRVLRRVGLETRIDDARWTRREIVLGPRASETLLLAEPPAAGVVTATLDAGDALATDDRALGWIPPAEPFDLLVVSDVPTPPAGYGDLAAAVPGSRIEVVEPDRFAARATGGRTVVFDGLASLEPPAGAPVLYVAPPPGNSVCPSLRAHDDAAVVDWEAEHPLLQGIEVLDALALGRTMELESPPWGRALVLGAAHHRSFPLLVAGERDGRRVACLAAALDQPLASADRVPLLLLTLATLDWLAAPAADTPLAVTTGIPVALPGATDDARDAVPPGLRVAGDPPVIVAERTGTHHLGRRLVLANLFDDRESDIGRAASADRPALAPAGHVTRTSTPRELAWWLQLVAALLLVAEWLVWRREVEA